MNDVQVRHNTLILIYVHDNLVLPDHFGGSHAKIAVMSRVPDIQLTPDQLGLHCIYILWTTKHIGMKHVDLSDWVAGSRY